MENAFDARGMIRKGVVQSINDTGGVQTVTVLTSAGAVHADVEVVQSYGFASVPPVAGCIAYLFCDGGDPANMFALLGNPSARLGHQVRGEASIYNAANNARVACRGGGVVEIAAGSQVTITTPEMTITTTGTVTITAPGGVTITGNLTVNGAINNTGTIHTAGGLH